jgi:hypothetical protein
VKEYLRTDGDPLEIIYESQANTLSVVYSVYDLINKEYIVSAKLDLSKKYKKNSARNDLYSKFFLQCENFA